METREAIYEQVGGVQYCPVHHGILDECNARVDDQGEAICDLADDHDGEQPCDPQDLFYVVAS